MAFRIIPVAIEAPTPSPARSRRSSSGSRPELAQDQRVTGLATAVPGDQVVGHRRLLPYREQRGDRRRKPVEQRRPCRSPPHRGPRPTSTAISPPPIAASRSRGSCHLRAAAPDATTDELALEGVRVGAGAQPDHPLRPATPSSAAARAAATVVLPIPTSPSATGPWATEAPITATDVDQPGDVSGTQRLAVGQVAPRQPQAWRLARRRPGRRAPPRRPRPTSSRLASAVTTPSASPATAASSTSRVTD